MIILKLNIKPVNLSNFNNPVACGTKSNNNFQIVVDTFISDMVNIGSLKKNSASSYKTRLGMVNAWNNGKSIDWVTKAIKTAKKNRSDAILEVDNLYKGWSSINGNVSHNNNTDQNCKSAYVLFAKWLIGQYQAKAWLSIDKNSDLDFCRLIAKHALFCTRDDAMLVRDGTLGCMGHQKSVTFSWFDNKYRRISHADRKIGLKIGDVVNNVTLDNNSKANMAIKNAIAKSLPIRVGFPDFSDYMACHIWDGTCYDERFHTSVFNLVLVPTALAGLTDYNDAVKQMLQYESARRLGVYPDSRKYGNPPSKPSFFDKITIWRQQNEHSAPNVFSTFKEVR